MKAKGVIFGLFLVAAAAASVAFESVQRTAMAGPPSTPPLSPHESRLAANKGPFGPGNRRMWQDEVAFELSAQEKGVLSLAFTPDGKYLISGGGDRIVHVWDMGTHQEVRKLEGHADIVTSVSCSDDGKWILSAGRDRAVILWDLATGKMLDLFQHYSTVSEARFLPGGRVATLTSSEMAIWMPQRSKPLVRSGINWSYWQMDVSPSGDIAVGSGSGSVVILDGKSLRKKAEKSRPALSRQVSSNVVRSVHFLSDDRLMIADSSGQWLWNRTTGEVEHCRALYMDDVIPMGTSNLFAGTSDFAVWCWDGGNSESVALLSVHGGPQAIAVDKSCKWLAVGGGGIWVDHMKTWVPRGPSSIQVYDVEHMPEYAMSLGDSTEYRPTLSVWDRAKQRSVQVRPKNFSPDLLPWE